MFRNATTILLLLVLGGVAPVSALSAAERWTEAEIAALRGFSRADADPAPADPSNRFANDPRAAEFGRKLFFDPRLSRNGQVSCATCHVPEKDFQDGLPLSRGVGTTARRAMPIAGTAQLPFLFWDGRKDSPWAQALGPLESPVEHGGTRAQYAHVIAEHYRIEYEAIFGPLPALAAIPRDAGPVADPAAARAWQQLSPEQRTSITAVFVNLGKAIAAFERTIEPGPSRFDRYIEIVIATGRPPTGVLTAAEVAGLRLFLGKASCIQCHNGPLFTNGDFHNTGVPAVAALPPDHGRREGVRQLLADEFNRHSPWSDAPVATADVDFVRRDDPALERAFKVPSLRNVAARAPYMHAGQIATLTDVLRHYNAAPSAPRGRSELQPLALSPRELGQLEAFLRTLSAEETHDATTGSDRPPTPR